MLISALAVMLKGLGLSLKILG